MRKTDGNAEWKDILFAFLWVGYINERQLFVCSGSQYCLPFCVRCDLAYFFFEGLCGRIMAFANPTNDIIIIVIVSIIISDSLSEDVMPDSESRIAW